MSELEIPIELDSLVSEVVDSLVQEFKTQDLAADYIGAVCSIDDSRLSTICEYLVGNDHASWAIADYAFYLKVENLWTAMNKTWSVLVALVDMRNSVANLVYLPNDSATEQDEAEDRFLWATERIAEVLSTMPGRRTTETLNE